MNVKRKCKWEHSPFVPPFYGNAKAVWLFETGSAKKPAYNFQTTPLQFQNQAKKVTQLQHVMMFGQTGNAPNVNLWIAFKYIQYKATIVPNKMNAIGVVVPWFGNNFNGNLFLMVKFSIK